MRKMRESWKLSLKSLILFSLNKRALGCNILAVDHHEKWKVYPSVRESWLCESNVVFGEHD